MDDYVRPLPDKTTVYLGRISRAEISIVVWAGEFHPGPNPKPDVQVSKHPAFQTVLVTSHRSFPYGTPNTESED